MTPPFVSVRFFVGVFAGFLATAMASVAVLIGQLGAPTASTHWAAGIWGVKRDIAAQMTGPRLLLLGGSATLCGLNAQQLEDDLGISTVNLGTYAGLGPSYMLDQLKTIARPGDTALLTFEYEIYSWTIPGVQPWVDPALTDYLMARDPDYLRQLPWRSQWDLIRLVDTRRLWLGWLHKLGWAPTVREDPHYNVYMIDGRGSMTGLAAADRKQRHYGFSQLPPAGTRPLAPSSSIQNSISSFCAWAVANDIRVIATYPPISEESVEDPVALAEVGAAIRQLFADRNVPVIGSATSFQRPLSQFFDSYYHLTTEATAEHTTVVADLLRPLLAP